MQRSWLLTASYQTTLLGVGSLLVQQVLVVSLTCGRTYDCWCSRRFASLSRKSHSATLPLGLEVRSARKTKSQHKGESVAMSCTGGAKKCTRRDIERFCEDVGRSKRDQFITEEVNAVCFRVFCQSYIIIRKPRIWAKSSLARAGKFHQSLQLGAAVCIPPVAANAII